MLWWRIAELPRGGKSGADAPAPILQMALGDEVTRDLAALP
jgi:hypothetical protein